MIKTKTPFFWTLADYQRFLRHADFFARDWAAQRIEQQYPAQAAESFVCLLTDPDPHLRIAAARAIGNSGDSRYEAALLAALPGTQGVVREWLLLALAQVGSRAILSQLIAELEQLAPVAKPHLVAQDATDMACPRGARFFELRGVIEALGYYDAPQVREVLWRFVERHPYDDVASYSAFESLLRHPDPATAPRLLRRYGELASGEQLTWQHLACTFAKVVGVERVAQEVASILDQDPGEVLELIEEWLGQLVPFSEEFEDALFATAEQGYAGLFPHVAAEFTRAAAERGDDVASWQATWAAGARPTGYRWRMLYAGQVLTTLAGLFPAAAARPADPAYRDLVGLALALLGQALTDADDEATLQAAADDAARRQVLLDILGSPRMNVLPDVVMQVAVLGPEVVPNLIRRIMGNSFWGMLRSLEALAQIAWAHPGAADAALPIVLNLFNEEESDYVLEAAEKVLHAIGPAAIAPAAARLGQGDFTYDIYVGGHLAECPTEAAVNVLLAYASWQDSLEDWALEYLSYTGHRRVMPVLYQYYEPNDSLVGTMLYTVGVLNGFSGPEMAEWRALAEAHRASYNEHLDEDPLEWARRVTAPVEPAAEAASPAPEAAPPVSVPARPAGTRPKKRRKKKAKAGRR